MIANSIISTELSLEAGEDRNLSVADHRMAAYGLGGRRRTAGGTQFLPLSRPMQGLPGDIR